MIKPLQPPWRAMEIPPLVAGATTFPRKRGHYGYLAMGPCLCKKAWKPILPPEQGWQGNTIRKGAKRPENRVTRFPVDAQRT